MASELNRHFLKIRIWRGGQKDGRWQVYDVPPRESQTVLDVVYWVQQNLDPDLSFRYACRVGMCGSCAMMVNGTPRWACRTHMSKVSHGGTVTIGPLRNLPVIKDLACDMEEFFERWVQAEGVFHGEKSRHDPVEAIDPQSARREAVDDAIECINCAICYASCDTVAADRGYLGPAALNRAWSLLNDDKDKGTADILDALGGPGGAHECHTMGNCTRHCPNNLNPMNSIAGIKKELFFTSMGLKRS